MVQTNEPRKIRKLQYLLRQKKDFDEKMVKKMFDDWAVTLGIHPWALGILAESQGCVTIPERLKIKCEIISNIFTST